MKKPSVIRIRYTPVAVAEIAARICYDSFHKGSEVMQEFGVSLNDSRHACKDKIREDLLKETLLSKDTSLLERLIWTNHHESIVEHVDITFVALNVSRGVLHHQVRHRMQVISVESTRYTMGMLALMFGVLKYLKLYNDVKLTKNFIKGIMVKHNVLVCTSVKDIDAEVQYFIDKTKVFISGCKISDLMSKAQIKYMEENITINVKDIYSEIDEMYKLTGKRNVGDNLKNGVTDTWATTFLATINMRSLKNYLKLRDSGASLSDTQVLAKEIKSILPDELLKLVVKKEG